MVRVGGERGAGPYVSPGLARELYLLRRHLGIGAHEAQNVLPRWEVNTLLRELAADMQANAERR